MSRARALSTGHRAPLAGAGPSAHPRSVDDTRIRKLLARQHGVIARRQLLEADGGDVDIERLVRRRVWARVHAGVYVAHTGPLSRCEAEWAAVLRCWPAALAGTSALRAHGLRSVGGDDHLVEVAVDESRRLDPLPGVRLTRVTGFGELAQLHLSPPRLRLEHAALTVASRATTEDAAVAVLADVCQARRTTALRLQATLARMPRLARRRTLGAVLDDAASGAFSALERRYLVEVERAHGLPRAERQRVVREDRRTAQRDVDYRGLRTVVELDGRLGHEWAADRWRDLDRDLAAAVAGDLTLRVGWRQVLEPCRLAASVAAVLRARGWKGSLRLCGPSCPHADSGGSPAPGAGDPPLSAGGSGAG